MTSSTKGLLLIKGLAQSPTPMETKESGNTSFKPLSKGVATSTSPRSLLRRIKKEFGDLIIELSGIPKILMGGC